MDAKDSTDSTDATDAMDATDMTLSMDATDMTDMMNTTDATDTTDSTDTTDTADTTDAMNPVAKQANGHAEQANEHAEQADGHAARSACGCGCAVQDGGRTALGVDTEIKARNLKRLRRIEGQVRGIHKMVEDDRYCADIMTQIASVHEALRGVGRELMRNHLKHCAASTFRSGDEAASETMYDELVDMMYRHAR